MSDEQGFEGEIVLDAPTNPGAPEDGGALQAKFVRYSGCQQVTLWLPMDGYAGYRALRITGPGERLVEDAPLTSRLNGRVQILVDTFAWPPGDYTITISHQDGWSHELRLEKLEEGLAPPAPEPPPVEPSTGEAIVYRDGFGNILPNEDLEMRAGALQRLKSLFGRRLEFEGNFRGGTIIYLDGDIRIPFSHEMCGGGVHFSIDVPVAARWQAVTGRPLSEREDIVAFVAEETRRRQASSWHYRIHEDRIDFVD